MNAGHFKSTVSTSMLLMTMMLLPSSSFVLKPPVKSTTHLYLDDWVADFIDSEIERQSHRKEYEAEWMEKNRAAIFSKIETDFAPVNDPDATDLRMHARDQKLAFKDPERYCADRCIATGNCDIFEDFYEMRPEDVIKFCTECVLSEDEEPCDIPEGFYDKVSP